MSKYSDKKFDESKPKKIRDEDDRKDHGHTATAGMEDNRVQTNIAASLALQASENEYKEDGGVLVAHDPKSNPNQEESALSQSGRNSMISEITNKEDDAKSLGLESASNILARNIVEEKDDVKSRLP